MVTMQIQVLDMKEKKRKKTIIKEKTYTSLAILKTINCSTRYP